MLQLLWIQKLLVTTSISIKGMLVFWCLNKKKKDMMSSNKF